MANSERGMRGCAEKITEVLGSIAGVRQVKPKVSRQRVLVRYAPDRVREEQLKEALSQAGYDVAEA